MTFLERWANPQPSKPPVLRAAPDNEAGSHGVTPAGDFPEMHHSLGHASDTGVGTTTASLKGQAVELWRNGRRFFLVADESDALEAVRRFGAHPGEVWNSVELELVASIQDQATRDEVESLKRQLDGCLAPDAAIQGIPWAEYQAKRLNELFRTQGLLWEPAQVTWKNIKHGERRESKRWRRSPIGRDVLRQQY